MGLIEKLFPSLAGGFAVGGFGFVIGNLLDLFAGLPNLTLPLFASGALAGIAYGLFNKDKK